MSKPRNTGQGRGMVFPRELTDLVTGIEGTPIGLWSLGESAHFRLCLICGQAVDARDLRQVLHHEIDEHERIPVH